MEQVMLSEGVGWLKELGPYGTAIMFFLYIWLDERGKLPKILSMKRNGKSATHMLNNCLTEVRSDIKNIREDIDEIKTTLKEKVSIEYVREVKHDLKEEIDGRVDSIHKRLDRMDDRCK